MEADRRASRCTSTAPTPRAARKSAACSCSSAAQPVSSTMRTRRVGADNTVDHIELTSSAAFPIDLAYRNINGQLEREQYNAILGGEWTTRQLEVRRPRDLRARRSAERREEFDRDDLRRCRALIVDYTGGEGAPNFSFPGIDTTDGALVEQPRGGVQPAQQRPGRRRRAVQRRVQAGDSTGSLPSRRASRSAT